MLRLKCSIVIAIRTGVEASRVSRRATLRQAKLSATRRFASTGGATRPPRVQVQDEMIDTPASRSRSWRKHQYASAGVVALSLGTVLTKKAEEDAQCNPRVLVRNLGPPTDAVMHPMEKYPWHWRWMYTIWRGIRLVILFSPLAAYVLVAYTLPVPQEWRDEVPELLVTTLEQAGCSFHKIGQWLSMRPDVCPPELISALGRLRTGAPAHEWEATEQAVTKAFQCDSLSDIFEEFEREPVASGSVAQVHKAKLTREARERLGIDGDREFDYVAVKILHPMVMESTMTDIRIIFEGTTCLQIKHVDVLRANSAHHSHELTHTVNTVGRMCFNLAMPFEESIFIRAMIRQLDLNWEAYNLEQFRENFANDGAVRFPKVAFSTDQVLVESWMAGKSISDLFCEVKGEGFRPAQATSTEAIDVLQRVSDSKRKNLARTIFDFTVKMYLRDNYIHGDMHGGNLMYSTDPDDERVIVLDAGLTTALEKDWASPFGYLLQALSTNNAESVAEKLIQFNQGTADVNKDVVKSEIKQIMEGTYDSANREPVNMGAMIGQILTVLQRHGINLRGDVALTIITMSISEGLIRQLDPGFDCVKSALPYFVRYRSWQRAAPTPNQWLGSGRQAHNNGLPVEGSRGLAVNSLGSLRRQEQVPLSSVSSVHGRVAAAV